MISNFLKSSVALLVALSTVSCSVVTNNGFDVKPNTTEVKSKATIVVPIKQILNSFNSKFSVKRYDFNDSKVYQTRIAVYDATSSTPEIEKFIKKSDNITDYPVSVKSGNKLIILETLEDRKDSFGNDVVLSRMMSTVAVIDGSTTTLKMNYGTIPEAKVLKALIETNVAVSSLVNLTDLTTLINKITGYDDKTNTYGGINPSYVDIDAIVANILANNGVVPVYQRGLFDTEVKGKLNVKVGFNRATILGNTANTFTLDSISNLSVNQQVVINPNTANQRILTISSMDTINKVITFYPNLDVGIGSSNLVLLVTGSSLEINDLTAKNISGTTDNATIMNDVSQGNHILRVKTNYDGKTLYKEVPIIVNSTNTNSINNQSIDVMVIPEQIFASSVILDQIENNKDLIVPSGGGITLTVNESQSSNIKARVIMSDGTINQNYQLTSSDTTIVSAGGTSISGVKVGSATVKIESNDKDINGNKVFITFNVNVVKRDNTSVTGSVPNITSFSPTYVAPTTVADTGTTIIIKGDYFDTVSNLSNTVSFNGIDGTTISTNPYDVTKTQIKVKVPVGATTGRISVSTAKGTFVSTNYLIVGSTSVVDVSGMVYVKGDTFYQGSNGNTDDNFYPRHKVVLNDFYIDKTEVTNKQFKVFIDAGGYSNPAFWSVDGWAWRNSNNIVAPSYWDDTRFNQDSQPVVGVSFYEAEAYANSVGKRLPTESEWEFAARGKDERALPWSGGASDRLCNGYFGNFGKDDGYQYTSPVASFTGDESPFGLKDMSGNAAEWVKDWYDAKYYSNSEATNPQGPTIGGTKSVRGGSWYNHPFYKNEISKLNDSLRTFARFYSAPTNRSNYIGFRTAK